jgi:hypothetical protein
MKKILLILTISFLTVSQLFACVCECVGDCSFNSISNGSEFVALVKVISYDDYLEGDIMGHKGKMPYSMTVEVIKKYKGKESRSKIKIWGDNGAECRPYISNFKIGDYYLIAPNQLGDYKLKGEKSTDYDFFSCNTDYLKVDLTRNKAFGEYSKKQLEIDLTIFEKELKK